MTERRQPAKPRHPELRPLSEDHHHGLVRARELSVAAEKGPKERRDALHSFLEAWIGEILPHFEDEERLLVPLIRDDRLRLRLRAEHRRLRTMAAEVIGKQREPEPDPTWVANLGARLHDHIRWEERELFPAIERDAHPDQLRNVGEALRSAPRVRLRQRRR